MGFFGKSDEEKKNDDGFFYLKERDFDAALSCFDESIEILKNSGAQVESKIYEGLGHNVCTDELDCVREMIDELINTK